MEGTEWGRGGGREEEKGEKSVGGQIQRDSKTNEERQEGQILRQWGRDRERGRERNNGKKKLVKKREGRERREDRAEREEG